MKNPTTCVVDIGNYRTTYTLDEETRYLVINTTHNSSLVEHKNLVRSETVLAIMSDLTNFAAESNSKDSVSVSQHLNQAKQDFESCLKTVEEFLNIKNIGE